MYNDIGKKIKTLAKVIAILGMIATVLLGLLSIISFDNQFRAEEQAEHMDMLVSYIILLILGPLLSWIAGFVLYGFGELVDKMCDIQAALGGNKQSSANSVQKQKNKELDILLNQGLITQEEYDKTMGKE